MCAWLAKCFLFYHLSFTIVRGIDIEEIRRREEFADIDPSQHQKFIDPHNHDDFELTVQDMTKAELEFYKFTLHDFDKNYQLDGLELMEAVGHIVDDHKAIQRVLEKYPKDSAEYVENRLKFIERHVDRILVDDVDKDGYISYAEHNTGTQGVWTEQAYDAKFDDDDTNIRK